jgi:tetratricopeptide (TPR) repeat protein
LAGRPSDGSDKSDKSDKSDLSDSSDSSEAASTAPKKRPRSIATLMAEWEKLLMKGRAVEIARGVVAALAGGLDDPEIHFIGGLVAEDVGDEPRARAHLARALIMEPSMLMARTALGRVYWRSGRLEAATDLIRSLPVEGPEDYGRHYHLALAHESAGDRAAALEAMHLALRDFFIETFDFHIRRIFDGWLRRVAAASEATA